MAKGGGEPLRKEYLSVKEAEELTSRSAWTWRRDVRMGKVASVKIGGQLLIPRSEIDRLMRENLRPARAATAASAETEKARASGGKMPPVREDAPQSKASWSA